MRGQAKVRKGRTSEASDRLRADDNLVDHANGDPDLMLLEEIAEGLAIHQVDGRGAVAGGFAAGVCGEGPVVRIRFLSALPTMAPRKSRTVEAPTACTGK